jgi:cell division septation protein DedD
VSGGGTNPGAKPGKDTRDSDPIAVLAQLATGEDPYTVVHQHGGRTRLRPLSQAKGKQRYRLAGGEVVARPTARFAIVGDRNGAALVSCFSGRVEVRAKHQQLSLEPHQAAIVQANGDVEQFSSLAAAQLGAEKSMDVHELVEAATRALIEAQAAPAVGAAPVAEDRTDEERTTALVGAAAAAGAVPEIVLPDASIGDEEPPADDEEADVEPFPEERQGSGRWILAALAVAALIALVLLAVLPGEEDDDDGSVAGPATSVERTTTTSGAPAAETTTPETTATTAAATTTTEAPTTTTIAPPTASIQPKSCVQQGTTITYTAGLTNTSETAATFDIRVAFIDQTGSEVGSSTATVEDVAPGASRDWSATGSVPSDLRDTGASCAVTSITGRPA